MGRYLGIDLHRNRFTVCTLAENNRNYFKTWELRDIGKFVDSLRQTDRLAVEASGSTRLFLECLGPHAANCQVVNPSRFKLISCSVRKTDKNDARLLALFLSKGLLPVIRKKSEKEAQLLSLTRTRDQLVRQRTALKNKVNNICASRGVLLKREELSSEKGLKQVLRIDFNVVTNVELSVLVEQIRSLNASIAKLEKTIGNEGPKLPGHKNLTSIKGIGKLGSTILLSVIGNIDDFENEGKLASYFGIVPRVSNSNETERSGRITKRGDKLGRTTLVQCALIAKRYSPYLSDFHEKIKRRRGGGKANIALARKFLNVIYHTLKNNWVWEDFPNGVLAEG